MFVESATRRRRGCAYGPRLASSPASFFAACLFFTPLTAIVPGEVAAAALVVIGAMMLMNARHVDWSDRATAIPVFLTVVLMPFTYSITAGVAAGVISYVAIKTAQGKAREIGGFMWVLTGGLPRLLRPPSDRELAGRQVTSRPHRRSPQPTACLKETETCWTSPKS